MKGHKVSSNLNGGKAAAAGLKMDLREKTREGLRALRLSDIPDEWVEALWDDNFCSEAVSLPYLAVGETVLLNEEGWETLVDACRHWPGRARNSK